MILKKIPRFHSTFKGNAKYIFRVTRPGHGRNLKCCKKNFKYTAVEGKRSNTLPPYPTTIRRWSWVQPMWKWFPSQSVVTTGLVSILRLLLLFCIFFYYSYSTWQKREKKKKHDTPKTYVSEKDLVPTYVYNNIFS